MNNRRDFLTTLAAGLGGASFVNADDRRKRPPNLMKPETRKSVKKGLDYLKTRQNSDGSFGSGSFGKNVAISGLAGMAFMANGSTPGRGPYGREVNRCVSFIVNNTQDSGFIKSPVASSHGPMYGHGFATLFLAEAYGMHRDAVVREKLVSAIKLIINTQNDKGGWRYEPKKQAGDISVTICQVMALRAARNAGIFVPNKTIDQCIDYVKRSQNPDGGFSYMLSQRGVSQFPRSAAGVVALYSAGIYKGDEIDRGLGYLMKQLPSRGGRNTAHFFYGQYYAVQAMWQAGGERWKKWYPAIHDKLLSSQQSNGAWYSQVGPEYAAAMACIILQMPNNHLPIFQH